MSNQDSSNAVNRADTLLEVRADDTHVWIVRHGIVTGYAVERRDDPAMVRSHLAAVAQLLQILRLDPEATP